MKVAAIQSNYIPWKGYFDIIHDADVFVFYDEVKYTKNSWRNRNRIYSKNGLQWLTIPIASDAVKLKISEVQFTSNDWQLLHYKTLTHNYASAPHFSQLKKLMDETYMDQTWTHLVDVNRFIIKRVSELLTIRTKFDDLKNYQTPDGRIERLLSLVTQMKATEYLSGPSGQGYIDSYEELFSKQNIQLTYKDYSGYPTYKQWNLPFESELSIFDMIAHVELSRIPDLIWKWREQDHRLAVNQ